MGAVSLSFHIFVGQVENNIMYFTGLWRTIWHRFISKIFWGRVEHIQKQHMQIFGFRKNQSKYLDISNCVFTKNCSTDKKSLSGLFRTGLNLHVRKISTLSVKQFKFFAKISYILDN